MINLGKQSKLMPAEVVQKAREFFGPGGLGLKVNEAGDCCARFEGGGGYVNVDAATAARGSDVNVTSQEWEQQARRFLEKI